MINALSQILCRGRNVSSLFCAANSFINLTWSQRNFKTLRLFSSARVNYQGNRSEDAARCERQLPIWIYIQNPVTWLINKLDFKRLKNAWDAEFDEGEFKRGTKQAVAVICTLISNNLWDNLRGLVTRQALTRLKRDVEVNWSDAQRRNINIEASDIKMAMTRRIHFLKLADQRFVDVDMLCMAMKFKEQKPSTDYVVIEMVARFHRNYTAGEIPNWTVTLFKVTRFSVHPGRLLKEYDGNDRSSRG